MTIDGGNTHYMQVMNYSFQREACRAEELKPVHGQYMLWVVRE